MAYNIPIAVIGDNRENNRIIVEVLHAIPGLDIKSYLISVDTVIDDILAMYRQYPHGFIAVLNHRESSTLYPFILSLQRNKGVYIISKNQLGNITEIKAEVSTHIRQLLTGSQTDERNT